MNTFDPVALFVFLFVAVAPAVNADDSVFCLMTEKPHDADTLTFVNITGYSMLGRPKTHLKIRVMYVDSPELDQAHGKESRDAVARKCMGYSWMTPRDIDNFGRILGSVDAGGDLAKWMLKNGHAHPFMVPRSKCKMMHRLTRSAINNKRGLWADDVVVLPADFRKDKKAKGKPRDEYLEDYR